MFINLLGKQFRHSFKEKKNRFLKLANNLLFYSSLAGLFIFIYDLGFVHSTSAENWLRKFYEVYAIIIFLILTFRILLIDKISIRRGWLLIEYLLILLLLTGLIFNLFTDNVESDRISRFFKQNFFTFGVIWYVFLIELSKKTLNLYQNRFKPALLFAISFLILIFLGTGLLMLPRATVAGISLLDAFFTATSAVCVTGLIVVDTATYFTTFGKTIILILIQVGGLGIMTFTSFLGMFFLRSSSFQNQLFMQNMVNEENFGQTMHTIVNIVKITLLIELTGAGLLYFNLDQTNMGTTDRVGFVLFHAISAFCNAGFSTLTDGLYDVRFRFAYFFQFLIAMLIILGGIGIPVILNFFRLGRQAIRKKITQPTLWRDPVSQVSLNVHTKIVVYTSAILLIGGTIMYFVTEYHSTLQEHRGLGKLMAAFFGSVTPRTAGFNAVDMTRLTVPTILIYLLLMWIGASPASTGGGIKTTTFAVAILNTLSVAKGKDRLEIYHREIKSKSVREAFAVMLLSFLVIGLSIFLILYLDPEQKLLQVAFEVFSAFSTVGLSLGITANLSAGSKMVLIFTMFLGRVGIFTLIAGMVTKVQNQNYRYPAESIIIT